MGTWYGLWNGGSGYSPPASTDLERFRSLSDAADALRERYNGGSWRQRFNFVFRDPECVLTPGVDHESYIDLYRWPTDADLSLIDLSVIDRRVVFGPRGGVRFE
ncbi:hypothetical protein LG943_12710 [Streptomonospora sp. S1-112]|uniref:Uncharacterized protein n=1 Tax=Streptomonospora mangrovi TaxID=2883123 RepID=A0A9X3SFS9_9ACTN|nr:hypothetical protein [Streptomonospora mangrovi]MDA0565170.1 hypothetical protein [Streptomonospora mangrovi]